MYLDFNYIELQSILIKTNRLIIICQHLFLD